MLSAVLSFLGFALFHVVLLVGLLLIPLGLPGAWVILGTAALFGLMTGFESLSLGVLGVLLLLAALAEMLEAFLGVFMARRYGASRQGMWGAFVGGIVGGIVGTPVFPIVGTLAGGLLGAFGGAYLLEARARRGPRERARAGFGAVMGRVLAVILKFEIGLAMVILILVKLY